MDCPPQELGTPGRKSRVNGPLNGPIHQSDTAVFTDRPSSTVTRSPEGLSARRHLQASSTLSALASLKAAVPTGAIISKTFSWPGGLGSRCSSRASESLGVLITQVLKACQLINAPLVRLGRSPNRNMLSACRRFSGTDSSDSSFAPSVCRCRFSSGVVIFQTIEKQCGIAHHQTSCVDTLRRLFPKEAFRSWGERRGEGR